MKKSVAAIVCTSILLVSTSLRAQRPGNMSDDELRVVAALVMAKQEGSSIRLDGATHKAWIDAHFWADESIFDKEKIAYVLMLMCPDRPGTVDIYDLQSGEKLKTYWFIPH